MRAANCIVLLLPSSACGRESISAPGSQPAAREAAGQVLAADAPQAKVPRLVTQPPGQADAVLSERLNWLRYDLSAVLRLSIDQEGHVVSASVVSVEPPDNELSKDFAADSAKKFEEARFEPPLGVAYPYSFNVSVRFAAQRDVDGRLK